MSAVTDIVVIGAGLAGASCAITAARAGAKVAIVRGGLGATSFSSGAFDRDPWWLVDRAQRLVGGARSVDPIDPDEGHVLDALGIVAVGTSGDATPLLATTSGAVRRAVHRDRALADLRAWAGRTVFLPRADRALWDADTLARGLTQSAPAELEITFRAVDVPILLYADEDRVADVELAARHDDPKRLAWLAERLSSLAAQPDRAAVLLGPWLGVDAPRATDLGELVGFPVGEALSGVAGTAGARLERAVARALDTSAVSLHQGRVSQVARGGGSTRVTLDQQTLEARALVFATGSFLGGGLLHLPAEHGAPADGPEHVRAAFASSIRGAPSITRRGRQGISGALLGPTLDRTAWPEAGAPGDLERVGFGHRDGLVAEGWFAAGDALAESPRSALHAIESGVRAARAALAIIG